MKDKPTPPDDVNPRACQRPVFMARAVLLGAGLLLATSTRGLAEEAAATDAFPVAPGPFTPAIESLRQYECPDWFRDAKFGIWPHWGPQSVPGEGNGYARNMYVQGSPQYASHLAAYGHPSKSGYKDLIPLWTAAQFEPAKLMDQFGAAGAKYFIAMAVHHDNFDLWDSSHQRWNAVNHGPRRDIVGAWASAARARGLRFGVSEQLVRSYTWFNTNKGSDSTGPLAGVPYDGADPQYADLYFPPHPGTGTTYPQDPPAWWPQQWYARISELIDKYQPEVVYTDGGLPFGEAGRRLLAHYYNRSVEWQRDPVVYTVKPLGPENGEFIPGVGVADLPRSGVAGIREQPWQTELPLNDWFYHPAAGYKPAAVVIHALADVVSRNGNLLLDPGLRPDGTLAPEAEAVLGALGAWLRTNGEAIYATRPWRVFGEGPTAEAGDAGASAAGYSFEDVRFTARTRLIGEAQTPHTTIYAIVLGWPGAFEAVSLKALAAGQGPEQIQTVRLLGYSGALRVQRDQNGLHVQLPDRAPSRVAVVLRID